MGLGDTLKDILARDAKPTGYLENLLLWEGQDVQWVLRLLWDLFASVFILFYLVFACKFAVYVCLVCKYLAFNLCVCLVS